MRHTLALYLRLSGVRLLFVTLLLLLILFLLGRRTWQIYAGPALLATKSAALLVDGNNNGKVDRGDTLRYTIVLTNSGDTDATNVALEDTIAADTTLVAGSLQTTPLAHGDGGYRTVGNVLLSVPVDQGLLTNDRDPDGSGGLTVATFNAASAKGGNVSVATNGSFTYNPAPGFSGADSFAYSVDDGEGNRITATVTITVGQVVWFINSAASGPGDGRFTTPFNSMNAFNALAADKAGDILFIYQGAGAYSGGLTLLNNQQLIGHGSGLTLAPNLSIAAATRPTLGHVALANGNTVRGVNINTSSAVGLSGINVGALTVNNVAVTSSGVTAVQISGGSSAMTVTLDSVNANGGLHGIDLQDNLGRFTVNGGTIQNTTGHAINLLNHTGPLDFTLKNSTITNAAAEQNGLHLEIPDSGAFGLVTVQNNTISNNGSTGVRASIGGTGAIGKIDISRNTLTNNPSGVDLATNDRASLTFDIHDNATMSGDQTQVNIAATDLHHQDGTGPTMMGFIRNNTITSNPASNGIAIWVVADGDGNITTDIANNQVSGFGDSGIAVESLGGTGDVHARIASNTVSTTASSPFAALYLRAGDGSSGETNLLCVNLSSNRMTAGPSATADYFLERPNPSAATFQIQNLSPSSATPAQTVTFVTATDAAPPATASVASGSNYTRATCATVNLTMSPPGAPLLAYAPVNAILNSNPYQAAATRWRSWWNFSVWRSRMAAGSRWVVAQLWELLAAKVAHASGETVTLDIGALDAGQALAITFDVRINNDFNGVEVCNQGTVRASTILPITTDDLTVSGAADPTCMAVVPPDAIAPDTTIDSSPPNPSQSTAATFTFSGTDNETPVDDLTFHCKLDEGSFVPCTSPQAYSELRDGLHSFQVRAVDRLGNLDPTPASFTWNVNPITPAPDLTATKTNSGAGNAMPDHPWTWTILVRNYGDGAATFTAGQLLLVDHLPITTAITYGLPTVTDGTNVTGIDQINCMIADNNLACTTAGVVTIGALTGALTVQFSAVSSATGDYANPRAGGLCQVDPERLLDEANEGNNDCADVVTVGVPDLTITKRHSGNFMLGQGGAQYTISVQNIGVNQTSGLVTVDEELPAGLTATAITGAGWLCTFTPLRCTRSDALAAGALYPPITLTVDVAPNAPLILINQVTVTGGNDLTPANNSAIDAVQAKTIGFAIYLPVVQRE